MHVRVDAVGNLIGHYPAAREPAPSFLIGSHLDTVPGAGAYDGVLGVMVGIAVVEALGGRRFPFAIEVVAFAEEEGQRYHATFLGSGALVGAFNPAWLEQQDRGRPGAQAAFGTAASLGAAFAAFSAASAAARTAVSSSPAPGWR